MSGFGLFRASGFFRLFRAQDHHVVGQNGLEGGDMMSDTSDTLLNDVKWAFGALVRSPRGNSAMGHILGEERTLRPRTPPPSTVEVPLVRCVVHLCMASILRRRDDL